MSPRNPMSSRNPKGSINTKNSKSSPSSLRTSRQTRKTRETNIKASLNLDGRTTYSISSGIPFLDHMLELMCKHGMLGLKLKAKGDLQIDDHHSVEDIGLVLGGALRDALGNMKGIRRYGRASVPMDEALAEVSLDISGRPYLVYHAELLRKKKIKEFEVDLIEDFLRAFVSKAGITLHVSVLYGRNAHHMAEAVFKALGRALREALDIDPRMKGVPSTKGSI